MSDADTSSEESPLRRIVRFALVAALVVAYGVLMLQRRHSVLRDGRVRATCINNLLSIDSAKEQWALEKKVEAGAAVQMVDLRHGTNMFLRWDHDCPAGGTFTVGAIGEEPTCSLGEYGHSLEYKRRGY